MDTVSFVGGMSVPAVIGRANATVPLAQLIIDANTVTLRPRGFARIMLTDFEVDLDQIVTACLLREKFMTAGIGITLRDGVAAYFWTFRQQTKMKALEALAARGAHVSLEPQPADQLWRVGSTTTLATLPRFPGSLQALAPVLLILSAVVLVMNSSCSAVRSSGCR